MKVKGKKALVFGGTSGIGLATAIMLRDEGCEVVAISRNPASAQITKEGVKGIKTLANNVRPRERTNRSKHSVAGSSLPVGVCECDVPVRALRSGAGQGCVAGALCSAGSIRHPHLSRDWR